MAATAMLPELARDSQLNTQVTPDYCVHFFSDTPKVTRKEIWKRTKRVGSGGFGTVWLETCIEGMESGGDIYRAVKVLQLPSGVPLQEAVANYGRELEALAKFSQRKYSRCFVKSYGWYQGLSSISICLEYMPLGDLRAFIAGRSDPRLDEPETQQIVSQVLDGLVFMHAEGFAHRDLKPANILIKSSGPDDWWVKLSDFGLSKRDAATKGATVLQGTPGFMAPELLGFLASNHSSGKEVWFSADLWSLGEITFQLATGMAVFADQKMLAKYTLGELEFPAYQLRNVTASPAMIEFVKEIMLAQHNQRPTAEAALAHPWLQGVKTAPVIMPRPASIRPSQISESSSGESSALARTVSSITDYRAWSTVTSALAISAHVHPGTGQTAEAFEEETSLSETVSDASQSSDIIPEHLRDPDLFSQMHSELAQPRLQRDPLPIPLRWGTRVRRHMLLSLDGSEDESESKLAAAIQEGLDRGPEWHCKDSDIRITSFSESVEDRNGSRQLAMKSLTAEIMDKLTGPSANVLAQVFRVTSLKGTLSDSHQVIFSPDSKSLATTSSGSRFGLWSVEKMALVRSIEDICDHAAFSPDSGRVAAIKRTGAACILSTSLSRLNEAPQMNLRGVADNASCVAFSPLGDQVVVGTSKGTIFVWDTTKATAPQKIKTQSGVLWIAYCSFPRYYGIENNIVEIGDDGLVRFWKYEVRSILPNRWARVPCWGTESEKNGINVGGKISAAAASKTFYRLAVAVMDGSIVVWHGNGDHWCVGLERESVMEGHNERVDALHFSPDSKLLISASCGSVKIWKVRGGSPVAVVRAPDGLKLHSVAFSPNSDWLASTSSDDVVRLWDIRNIQNLSDVQDHLDRASFIAVSPDRQYMASVIRELHNEVLDKKSFLRKALNQDPSIGNDVATLIVWDAVHTRPLTMMRGSAAEILSVSFSTDSKRVAAVSADHVVRIWDVGTGECLNTIASRRNSADRIPCATLSAGLLYCAVVFRFHVKKKMWHHHRREVYTINSEPRFAISLCDIGLEASQTRVRLSCKTLTGTRTKDDILAMVFSPDAKKLAAVDQNDNVTVWDTATGGMTIRLCDITHQPPRGRCPFQPGLRNIGWDISSYRSHLREVGSPVIQFISTSDLVAFSGLSIARVWNIEAGGQPLRRIGASEEVSEEIYQYDGGFDISRDRGLANDVFKYCSYSTSLAASPDGARCVILTPRGQQLALWDMRTGERVTMLIEDGHGSDLCHLSFSPDSRWLITASSDDILVRDAARGHQVTHITVGLSWPLRTVAFWPDSRYIISGCYKGMLQFWDVESGAMVKAFEGHTGRRSFVL